MKYFVNRFTRPVTQGLRLLGSPVSTFNNIKHSFRKWQSLHRDGLVQKYLHPSEYDLFYHDTPPLKERGLYLNSKEFETLGYLALDINLDKDLGNKIMDLLKSHEYLKELHISNNTAYGNLLTSHFNAINNNDPEARQRAFPLVQPIYSLVGMLSKNQSIEKLSFEACGLGDEFAVLLTKALSGNAKGRITDVNLKGNDISPYHLDQINKVLARNQEKAAHETSFAKITAPLVNFAKYLWQSPSAKSR